MHHFGTFRFLVRTHLQHIAGAVLDAGTTGLAVAAVEAAGGFLLGLFDGQAQVEFGKSLGTEGTLSYWAMP